MSTAVQYSAFSGWLDRPDDVSPALTGELECDVAIVGGGYTGMAAAARRAGRRRGPARIGVLWLGSKLAQRRSSDADDRGRSAAARHRVPSPRSRSGPFRRRRRPLHRGIDRAPGHRVRVRAERERLGRFVHGPAPARGADCADPQRVGGEVAFVEGRDAGLPHPFLGGILERAGGILNPGMFARGLRGSFRKSGARLFERTAVQAVERWRARSP